MSCFLLNFKNLYAFLNILIQINLDEKTETKKSPNSPKKNVQTATTSNKSKVKKEPNTVASNNAKKKHASKNDEVSL